MVYVCLLLCITIYYLQKYIKKLICIINKRDYSRLISDTILKKIKVEKKSSSIFSVHSSEIDSAIFN
jgi:hypothetical protein